MANAVGFNVAFLSEPVDERCFIVPPHAAVAFPYWFLISLSGVCLLWVCGLLGPISATLYGSKQAQIAMAVVVLLFVGLNLLPHYWKVPYNSSRDGIVGRLTMTFSPDEFSNRYDVRLAYGFSIEHYVGGGTRKMIDRGFAKEGWTSAKVMENLVIALVVAVMAGLGIERLRNRWNCQTAVGSLEIAMLAVAAAGSEAERPQKGGDKAANPPMSTDCSATSYSAGHPPSDPPDAYR